MGGEPSLNGGNIGVFGSSEDVHFVLGEPLAVIGARWVGNVKELLLETVNVVLLEPNMGLDQGTMVSLSQGNPASRQVSELVELDKRAILLLRRGSQHTCGRGDNNGNPGDGNHSDI